MIRVGDQVRLKGTLRKAIVFAVSKRFEMIVLDRKIRTHLGWYQTFKKEELEIVKHVKKEK